MISEAIAKIQETTATPSIVKDKFGCEYIFHPHGTRMDAVQPPAPEVLYTATLTSVIEFADFFKVAIEMIHVRGYDTVDVYAPADPTYQSRTRLMSAYCESEKIDLSSLRFLEDFQVKIMTQFARDENAVKLIQLLSSIEAGSSVKISDDGISQQVVARRGIDFEDVDIPNPIQLSPFVTFSEIEQPQLEYVLRMGQEPGSNNENQITCRLIQVSSETWKLNCIERICNFLKEKIDDSIAIIA